MDILFLLLTGFAIGISGAMIPGPLTLFTVSETLKTDKFAGLKVISGHIIIEFIIIVIIFFGFYKFLTSRALLSAVSIIGGSAFIIMGIILFLNAGKMRLSSIKTNSEIDKGLVIGGVFFSAISPGFLVWWATIGVSTIIRASLLGILGVTTLVLGHWLADILWYGFLSYAVDKGKMFLSDRLYQNIIRSLSLLLMILGTHFLIIGLSH